LQPSTTPPTSSTANWRRLAEVVADAGPLIAFGRIDRLELLPQVLGRVLVPDVVAQECAADPQQPGARAISAALKSGLISRVPDPEASERAFAVLDAGESAAIGLALQRSAAVLIDEKLGRRIAANLGVAVIGSAGVLLAAKRRGLVEAVGPIIDAFTENGYRFSPDLVHAVRVRAGEA
jgi:predicted nucleic acid-binding protein